MIRRVAMEIMNPILRTLSALSGVRAVAVFDARGKRLGFYERLMDQGSCSEVMDALAEHWSGQTAASSGRLLGQPFISHPAGDAMLIVLGTRDMDEYDADIWRHVQCAARDVSMRLFLREDVDDEPVSQTMPSIARPPGF